MYRGTTLAMQSTQDDVLEAVQRKNIGLERYRELKRRYDLAGIPTYVDLIIGLPKETRESWMNGLCELLETGHHENIRCFGLFLLPNTQMEMHEQREQYGFQTTWKKITDQLPPDEAGEGELVFATNTLSFDDWVDGRIFFEVMIAAMHNGGYTRFLSKYLNDEGLLSYREFYVGLFEDRPHSVDGSIDFILDRMMESFRFYIAEPTQAQNCQVKAQPKMRQEVERFISANKKHRWWTRDWAWFAINQRLDRFYKEVTLFLEQKGVDPEANNVADVLAFQKDLMLTEDYTPELGKTGTYQANWPRYFFGDGELERQRTSVHFTDTAMGVDHQHPLVANSPADFALAACGMYYPDGTHRRFFHQPECMVSTPVVDLPDGVEVTGQRDPSSL